jgi:hypothetical protein
MMSSRAILFLSDEKGITDPLPSSFSKAVPRWQNLAGEAKYL